MRSQRLIALAALTLAATACGVLHKSDGDKKSGGSGEGKGKGDPSNRPVPVVTTTVEKRDIPIFLDGLGSVAAYYTVTLTPLVDGVIEKVLFKEGQFVHKGDLLVQIDPRPFEVQLHTAEGQLERDGAQLKAAQLDLTRYQDLAAKKLLAQQQADDQVGVVGQAEGAVKIDQAAIESAKLNLEYAAIKSPIDGVTGIRLVDPGNVVRAAMASQIVVLTQLNPIAVLFTLPEDVLPEVSKEMQAGPLKVEAWSRDGLKKLGTGETLLINNQINQQTATLQIKSIFDNPDNALWPNQFVKARLLLETKRGVIAVPAPVVQRGPKGTFAYVIEDGAAKIRPVTVDMVAGDDAIIASGLNVGDEVVVDGQNSLKPDSRVTARPMNAPPGQRGKLTEREGAKEAGQ